MLLYILARNSQNHLLKNRRRHAMLYIKNLLTIVILIVCLGCKSEKSTSTLKPVNASDDAMIAVRGSERPSTSQTYGPPRYQFLTFYKKGAKGAKKILSYEKHEELYRSFKVLSDSGYSVAGRVTLMAYSEKDITGKVNYRVCYYDIEYDLDVTRIATQYLKGHDGFAALGVNMWPEASIGPCSISLELLAKKTAGVSDPLIGLQLPAAPRIPERSRFYF